MLSTDYSLFPQLRLRTNPKPTRNDMKPKSPPVLFEAAVLATGMLVCPMEQATVTLDGDNSAFGQSDYINNNTGTLNVVGGRSFSTRSGSLKNYGAINLQGGTFTVNGDFTVFELGNT